MLTLVDSKDAKPLVQIYDTKNGLRKKAVATVYFTHHLKEDNKNVAPCFATLTLHKDHIKKINQVSENEYREICEMVDNEEEPDVSHPLRKAYWDVRDRFETSLLREMYIGDEPGIELRFDIPTKMSEWPGTMTLFGSSGAGKTYFLVQALLRYLKRTGHGHATRNIIWMSPEEKIDKTLKPLKKQRWSQYYTGIDISEKAVRDSKIGAESYFKQHIEEVIDRRGEDAFIVMDDFVDAAQGLYPYLEKLYNTSIRVARHRNSGVASLQHTYAGHRATSQSLQSNKFVVVFPRSQQQRCITFLKDHLSVPPAEARVIVKRFASLDRSMIIHMHAPVAIYNKDYLLLL